MSYIVTDPRGLGTNGATAGAQAGGQAGSSSSGIDVGGVIGAAGSALTSIIGGAINLANNIDLWRQQRQDIAVAREEAWAAEFGAIQQGRMLDMMEAEELAAQNAIIEEQNRLLEEQERTMAHEAAALQSQIRRAELQQEQQERAAEAMRFRMPTWGWWAVAAVGVLAVAGYGAYSGLKGEEDSA